MSSVIAPNAPIKPRRRLFADAEPDLDNSVVESLAQQYEFTMDARGLSSGARVDQAVADLADLLALNTYELGSSLEQASRAARAQHLLKELDNFVTTRLVIAYSTLFSSQEEVDALLDRQRFVNDVCYRVVHAFHKRVPHGVCSVTVKRLSSLCFLQFMK